ncbi:MAG: DNA helicase UvrD [Candidatus Omnitrophica bacterium CG07_land_8_20_14_0_80_42_15]|uniref:DNA helicase UvrD n=1 Tax=Candidatus Aquitaenariimonas noxiae TaxID=1974741 RepID=A0A2J0L4J2_9BACT|nr:MAG: DNA helicase UvrD [Candidatus Omnitrophica bacterium CG07_land_8_20_14_0_80_42_15]
MFICDFHVHSKYSRATSADMDIEHLAKWAKIKGIDLLGTGDFTHPEWLGELKKNLAPVEYGVFEHNDTFFILTSEVSNIYFKAGKSRKIHNIIFAPSFEVVAEINKALSEYGDLYSDGRPILRLESDKLVKKILSVEKNCMIIPAHIWTPHFSLFGANSGFDSIEECFEEETPHIYALETGLSSDPAMNWRCSALDRLTLVSNSDSHSPKKIGREANIFNSKMNYLDIIETLKTKDKKRFLYTIEFFPEEGKYHWDGHRKCSLRLSPAESRKVNNICPTCGSKLTIGVMHRVEKLCDRDQNFVLDNSPGYKHMVPLAEIIAGALGIGAETVGVEKEYTKLIGIFGSEFNILLNVPEEELRKRCSPKVAVGILRTREGKIKVIPGYDDVYGEVKIFDGENEEETREKQLSFF